MVIGAGPALSVQHDEGWRDFTGLGQQKASASASFEFGAWDAIATASLTNLNQETAGFLLGDEVYLDGEIAQTNANPEAYRDASTARASVRLTRDYDGFELTLTPYALTQDMEFRQHFLPYKGIEENGHDAIGLMSRVDNDMHAGVDLRIGADLSFANGYLIETQACALWVLSGRCALSGRQAL